MESTARRTPEQLVMLARELGLIARSEDDLAASAAARTPYWAPQPTEVGAHREAARALREKAAGLEVRLRACELAAHPGEPVLC